MSHENDFLKQKLVEAYSVVNVVRCRWGGAAAGTRKEAVLVHSLPKYLGPALSVGTGKVAVWSIAAC